MTQDACQGQQNGMISSTTEGGLPPYTYNWSNGQLGASIEGLIPGEYDLTVTDSNGCTLQATTEIKFVPLPQLELLPEDVNCFGEANGALQLANPDSSLLFSLDGATFDNTDEWMSLEAGFYTLFVRDSKGCESEFPFNIQEPPAPVSVSLPVSLDLELGDDQLLQPKVSPEGDTYDYVWSPPEGLSCTDCPDPLAAPLNTTTYSLIVTDSSGCSGQSSVRISVINDVVFYIPNAFTPNADGINDFFTVFSESGLVRVQQLLIFDRWGEKIYERTDFSTNDMSLGWDGRFRGQLMNPGVFVYLAEIEFIDGSLETVSGSVTLVR